MLYNNFAKYILLPLYYYKSDNQTLKRLATLEKSQYLSAEAIRAKQFADLKRLLVHCYCNVPFYRERFDQVGFNPMKLSNFSDLVRIPYLTKDDLQKNLPRLVAKNFTKENLFLDSSGGSTGKPTNFYKDKRRYFDGVADQYRHDRWCGWDIGDKVVKLWGAQRDFEIQPSFLNQIAEKYVFRIYCFNAFDIKESRVLEDIAKIKLIKPSMVMAYTNVAYLFAKIIKDYNLDLSELRLKGLICSAETLTEQKRTAIESAFCCKVLNRYGSREVGMIASECLEQNGLHINTDGVYLEIEKGGRATAGDEPGEIIVTDLWNYGMPFVRYQMGDVASKSSKKCDCGRNTPLINDIQGRVSDFFVDAKGGLVHGEYFTHLFYGLEGVEQFQFVQEAKDLISLRILPGKNFTPSILDSVILKTKQCIGSDVEVDIKICTESFVEESGKFRFTVSKVSNDYFNSKV